MKIRIKGNSVRYRLSQTDVRTLADTGRVTETTQFGPTDGQVFRYALEAREDMADGLEAAFADGCITLYLPTEAAHAWPNEERVGFENQLVVAPGVLLQILVEKDFTCLDEVAEDQSDNYPNPMGRG